MRHPSLLLLPLALLLGPDAGAIPPPQPDVIDPELCKPARMAIEKNREGRKRSLRQWAEYVTVQTLTDARAGTDRYWAAYRKAFLSQQKVRVDPPPRPEPPSDGAGICRPMAKRDLSFCKNLGDDAGAMCRALLTAAAGGEKACGKLGNLAGECRATLAKGVPNCESSPHPQLCKLIAQAKAPNALKTCKRDHPRYPCLALALVRGLGGEADACDEMIRVLPRERQVCKAVVAGKPKQCPTPLPKNTPAPVETEPKVRATLIGHMDTGPSVVLVGQAAEPALCVVEVLLPKAKGRKAATLWTGTMRIPEFDAPLTIAEHPIADTKLARTLDPVSHPALKTTVRCVPRHYW